MSFCNNILEIFILSHQFIQCWLATWPGGFLRLLFDLVVRFCHFRLDFTCFVRLRCSISAAELRFICFLPIFLTPLVIWPWALWFLLHTNWLCITFRFFRLQRKYVIIIFLFPKIRVWILNLFFCICNFFFWNIFFLLFNWILFLCSFSYLWLFLVELPSPVP